MKILTLVLTIVLLLSTAAYAYGAQDGALYAVLINGGRNRLTNHERYWNDCAFLYRTLRQTYHVPKRNISVLMSDGSDPEKDMLRADGLGFLSSPMDLDSDGQWDVANAATIQTVSRTFMQLSNQLTANDRLLLFIIDHGGSDDQQEDSYVWLWNDERLYDYELPFLLYRCPAGSVCVLMGQCYSGGFISELMYEGCIVSTACDGSELSWKCPDRPYDEFIYHWTCAVNKADEAGNKIDADKNGDGLISMREAFDYARSHDRRPETPQYASCPEDLGDRWTLDGVIPVDIQLPQTVTTVREVFTPAGMRLSQPRKRQLNIIRQGGKTKKVIK